MKKERIVARLIKIAEELVEEDFDEISKLLTPNNFPILKFFEVKYDGTSFEVSPVEASLQISNLVLDDGLKNCVDYIDLGIDSIDSMVLTYDSRCLIEQYASKDDELTKKIQADFEESYAGKLWTDWIEEWLKGQGFTVVGEGENTYNWDNAYWWGSVFEYVRFVDDKGNEGAVFMWHLGGDVRGNYEYPEVWFGNMDEFFGIQHVYSPEEEWGYLLGYGGDADLLIKHIELLSALKEGDMAKARELMGYSQLRQKRLEELGQQRLPLDLEGLETEEEEEKKPL